MRFFYRSFVRIGFCAALQVAAIWVMSKCGLMFAR